MHFDINPKAISSTNDVAILNYEIKKDDNITRISATNKNEDVTLKEIMLIDMACPFNADTPIYGEGFSMSTQYKGTVKKAVQVAYVQEIEHYRYPVKENINTVFNYAVFDLSTDNEKNYCLIGFSSCNKFAGEIRFNTERLEVILNTENITLHKGETWVLDDLFIGFNKDRNDLLSTFSDEIVKNHPPLPLKEVPNGWCSWYCYGPCVTENDIVDNLRSIKKHNLNLKYIQVDDGYQKFMGDWLTPSDAFPHGIKPLFDTIISEGFEPAIWVAPFIADRKSELFKNHPDWFIKDENGEPLAADTFTYGGWRGNPWYMLDATNPEVYAHLKHVFHVMRHEWNCKYFKLDANLWGCMHKGIHYNKDATKIESYRLGMKAILEGAGSDSFLLGCSAPIWPTIGTVHANRITNDIFRTFDRFKSVATECFNRNWLNEKIWINDPDCITVEKRFSPSLLEKEDCSYMMEADLNENEYLFHATYIYASGGLVLSGDGLAYDDIERLDILRRLIDTNYVAAKFDDLNFNVGRIKLDDKLMLCLFNWNDEDIILNVDLDKEYTIYDVWNKKELGTYSNALSIELKPHLGLLLECK